MPEKKENKDYRINVFEYKQDLRLPKSSRIHIVIFELPQTATSTAVSLFARKVDGISEERIWNEINKLTKRTYIH